MTSHKNAEPIEFKKTIAGEEYVRYQCSACGYKRTLKADLQDHIKDALAEEEGA